MYLTLQPKLPFVAYVTLIYQDKTNLTSKQNAILCIWPQLARNLTTANQ